MARPKKLSDERRVQLIREALRGEVRKRLAYNYQISLDTVRRELIDAGIVKERNSFA